MAGKTLFGPVIAHAMLPLSLADCWPDTVRRLLLALTCLLTVTNRLQAEHDAEPAKPWVSIDVCGQPENVNMLDFHARICVGSKYYDI